MARHLQEKTMFAKEENQTVTEKLIQKRHEDYEEKIRSKEAFNKDLEEAVRIKQQREAKLNGQLKPI